MLLVVNLLLTSFFSNNVGSDASTDEVKKDNLDEGKEESVHGSSEEKSDDEKETLKKQKDSEEKKKENENAKDAESEKSEKKNTTETIDKKPKIVFIKENVTALYEDLGVPALSDDQMENSLKK